MPKENPSHKSFWFYRHCKFRLLAMQQEMEEISEEKNISKMQEKLDQLRAFKKYFDINKNQLRDEVAHIVGKRHDNSSTSSEGL